MRAIIKTSYFNQPKPQKRKPDKQKQQESCEKLHNYYLRTLAAAFQSLMINMITHMKRDFNLIEQLSKKVNQRTVRQIFYAWKEQSQQPQPFKLQLPFSPPRKDLTNRSTAKKSLTSKTPKHDVRFYTPGKDSVKTITQNSETLTTSDKKATLFRLRKIWDKMKLFANFQKHLAFKSRHFRNFYIIRKYFHKLQAVVFIRKAKLTQYEKSKCFFTLRICFSKWYDHGQRRKKHQFILMKQEQKQRILLLQKGLKGLYLNKKQSFKKTETSDVKMPSQEQKKLKLIPKKH